MEEIHQEQLTQETNITRLTSLLIAFAGSLSSVGLSMMLIGLSSHFYEIDHEGVYSSSIYVLYYLGVGIIGIVGGWLLQRFSPISLGVFSSIGNALILLLTTFLTIDPRVGLSAIFLIFLLNGIDHPNAMRFFNAIIPEKNKLFFFSIKESLSYLLGLISPILAILIINSFGIKVCFLFSAIIYLISAIPWLLFKRKFMHLNPNPETSNFWKGFKSLVENYKVRNLTISRLLNNLAYVGWTASLPILIGKISLGDVEVFSMHQGIATSVISCGFVLASFIVVWIEKKYPPILTFLIWGASLLGYGAIILLALVEMNVYLLYLSAFLNGFGTYCFRISGITVGQAITPKESLGPVIIAGDALVRLWSFGVSLFVLEYFRFSSDSYDAITLLLLILASFSLLSPLLIIKSAKSYLKT